MTHFESVEKIDGTVLFSPDGEAPDPAPWPLSIVTGMFMHGGFWAVLLSVAFLGIFGPAVEGRLGRLGFLALYLASGVAAAFGQSLLDADSTVPFISAAGAVAGVIAAHLVLFRGEKVVWLVLVPLLMGAIELSALATAAIWLGLQLLPGVGGAASPDFGDQVMYLAPFAGFAFGLLAASVIASLRGRTRPAVA